MSKLKNKVIHVLRCFGDLKTAVLAPNTQRRGFQEGDEKRGENLAEACRFETLTAFTSLL